MTGKPAIARYRPLRGLWFRRICVIAAVLDLTVAIAVLLLRGSAWAAAADAAAFGFCAGVAQMEYWRLQCYSLADTVDELLAETAYFAETAPRSEPSL